MQHISVSSLLSLLLALLLSSSLTSAQTTYSNQVIRMIDNRMFVGNITLDTSSTTSSVLPFFRLSLLTTPNYQVGFKVTVTGARKANGLMVYTRSYATDTARNIPRSNPETDYDTQVLNGAYKGTLLNFNTVRNNSIVYFSLPLIATAASKCSEQVLQDNWLTIDFHLPSSLVIDDGTSTVPFVTADVVFNWEDIRLSPPDASNPLSRPLPVIEKPRTLVTGLELVQQNGRADQDLCINEITVTVQFTPPNLQYVTQYWLYIVSNADSVSNVPATPTDSDVPIKISATDASHISNGKFSYTFSQWRVLTPASYVLVYTANAAGRDDTGVSVGPFYDYNAPSSGCQQAKDLLEDDDEDFEEMEDGTRIRKASQNKFTEIDTQAVTTTGNARHFSNFAYKRTITGRLSNSSLVHMYTVNVSSMATFNLSISNTFDFRNTTPTGNFTGTTVGGVVLMASSVARCVRSMSTQEIIALAQDNPNVIYAPLSCLRTSSSLSFTDTRATHTASCTLTSTTWKGSQTFNFYEFCSSASKSMAQMEVYVLGESGLVGTYTITFEMTDYTTTQSHNILGELQVSAPDTVATLAALSSDSGKTNAAALLASLTSATSAQAFSPSLSSSLSYISLPFSLNFSSSASIATTATLLESGSLLTTAAFNTYMSLEATGIRVRARPSVELSGCMERGGMRDISVPVDANCVQSDVQMSLVSGMVRGMFLRKDALPNAVSFDSLASWPETRVMASDTCARDHNLNQASGTWYGRVFLLSGADESVSRTLFTVRLSAASQTGYEQANVTGSVCCNQMSWYWLNVAPQKILSVAVTSQNLLGGVFIQKDSCPTGEASLCDEGDLCYYTTSPSSGTRYEKEVDISAVSIATTNWCVGIKSAGTGVGSNSTFVFSNKFVATPSPTPTPVPSYDPCSAEDAFCDSVRSVLSASSAPPSISSISPLTLIASMLAIATISRLLA